MTDAAVSDTQGHGKVAPADELYANVGRPAESKTPHELGDPVHPAQLQPQTPTFPKPIGVPHEGLAKLVEQGVAHTYHGLGRVVDELRGQRAEADAEAEPEVAAQ